VKGRRTLGRRHDVRDLVRAPRRVGRGHRPGAVGDERGEGVGAVERAVVVRLRAQDHLRGPEERRRQRTRADASLFRPSARRAVVRCCGAPAARRPSPGSHRTASSGPQ